MNIPVVFLLVVLGCSQAEGVSKCELRDLVLTELQNLQDGGLSLDPKVVTTRIVCHAEKSSNFNTSAVTTQGSDGGSSSNRKKRNTMEDMLEIMESEGMRTTTVQPKKTVKATQKWTFYGIFQLGNLLVCTDEVSTDPEICNYNCNTLIDDDITNDIRCLTDIIRKLLKDGFNQGSRFMEMIRLIYDSECDGFVYSDYFQECQ
ncbi:alpha-lactalbumin-like [Sphaeramia orbicularis]|uniref:alpha-lactalbumin-like n=1 Tax=Sphaeramia orbicularis TaxID=375764 RepID=UPI00117C0600|nr:alpha-lactalbumin-like [Sphaeramia orbicularis]